MGKPLRFIKCWELFLDLSKLGAVVMEGGTSSSGENMQSVQKMTAEDGQGDDGMNGNERVKVDVDV